MNDSVTIDGSYGEGGGQIVRSALALSVLTGKPVEIFEIRSGRRKPGLKAQHLTAVKALTQLCGASVAGDHLGSQCLRFQPGVLNGGSCSAAIGTAGSLTLLLQSLLLPCALAPRTVKLRLQGGTDTNWSPPWDYFAGVIAPWFDRVADVRLRLLRRGYFPKGGGSVELTIQPRLPLADSGGIEAWRAACSAAPLQLVHPGRLLEIHGVSHASGQLKERRVAERQITGARRALAELNVPVRLKREYCTTASLGSGIILWAVRESGDALQPAALAADGLGAKNKAAETVGEEAGRLLTRRINSGAVVDEHLADNLIPLLALIGGCIRVSRISEHITTNIHVVQQFIDADFSIEGSTITAQAPLCPQSLR